MKFILIVVLVTFVYIFVDKGCTAPTRLFSEYYNSSNSEEANEIFLTELNEEIKQILANSGMHFKIQKFKIDTTLLKVFLKYSN